MLLAVAACGDDDGPGDDTWVPHNGGTVCHGANATPVSGDDVWVSPSGDDTNAGTSSDEPFATLAHALCNASPGQTIHVGLGTYPESVFLATFGDAATPITISGEVGAGGELPVIDGERALTMGIAIVGEDEENRSGGFVVENLEFTNYTDAGLFAAIADNITFRNCKAHDNGFHAIDPENAHEGYGIAAVDVVNLLVDGAEAYANGPDAEFQQLFSLGTGVDIFGSRDVIVRNSNLHDNIGGGLLFEDCIGALAEDNVLTNNQLDARGDWWDGAAWIDGGRDITIRNNTFAGNLGPGLMFSDEGVQNPTGYVAEDNVFNDNMWGIYIWNFGVCPLPDTSVLQMSGNTFSNNSEADNFCNEWDCGVGEPCG